MSAPKIVARFRGLNAREQALGSQVCVQLGPSSVVFTNDETASSTEFLFDRVYGECLFASSFP